MLKEGNFKEEYSSTIKSVSWKEERTDKDISLGLLKIEFRTGSIYEYSDVPERIYYNFSNAVSKGKYFHREIARSYNYKKLN